MERVTLKKDIKTVTYQVVKLTDKKSVLYTGLQTGNYPMDIVPKFFVPDSIADASDQYERAVEFARKQISKRLQDDYVEQLIPVK